MKHFYDRVQFASGVGAGGATVTVYVGGTGQTTLATLFSNPAGGAKANPLTADSVGNYDFYAADGHYDVRVVSGSLSILQTDVGVGDSQTSGLTTGNGIVWVGTGTNNTLASAYALLPATGGTVMVPPGYTETLSSNLVLNKSNAGFVFMGSSVITMGTNQVTMASSVRGAFIKYFGIKNAFLESVRWIYSGTGIAFSIGDTSTSTSGVALEGLSIDLTTAGTAAIALTLTQVVYSKFSQLNVFGIGGVNTQVGVVLTDTGGSIGTFDNIFDGLFVSSVQKCVRFTGVNANLNLFLNPVLNTAVAGNIGVDIQSGVANTFICADLEGLVTAINIANLASANNNRFLSTFVQSNTTDVVFGAASHDNYVDTVGNVTPTVSDSGTNNTVWAKNTYKLDASGNVTIAGTLKAAALGSASLVGASNGNTVTLLNVQGPSGAVTGTGSAVTLYTYTLNGNVMANLRGVRVSVALAHSAGAAAVVYALTYGGQTVFTNSNAAAGQGSVVVQFFNAGVTNSQKGMFTAANGVFSNALTNTSTTVDSTANQAITITFNVANTDQVTPEMFVVELIQ